MDAKQFLAEFGHIAGAPGGVQRLRELVLFLAVSGKLLPNTTKLDAKDFVKEIEANRKEKIERDQAKPNKKVKKLPKYFPFDIPENWSWARFGDLAYFSAGRTPPRKESIYWNTGDYPWFSIADMQHQKVISKSAETVSEEARKESFKSSPIQAGTLIMSFKLTIGRLSVLGVDAYHNEAIISIHPYADELKQYFLKCLNGFDLLLGNKAAIKGNTLNQDSISNILVSMPPKAEISRIVAKVDELMALCDKLETQQQQKRKLQNHLRQSTLAAVASAESPEALRESWKRLEGSFSYLFAEAEDVEELRNSILKLSSSGRLTVPLDTDTSAEETLKSISGSGDLLSLREKRELQSLSEISKEDNGKLRLSLGHVARVISGQHLKPESYNTNGIGIPYITGPAEFEEGVPKPNKWTEERRAVAKKGDILLTVKGSGVGKTAICDTDELAISRQLMAISPIESVNKAFIATTIDAANDYFQQQKLGIAIPGIGRKEVLNLDMVLSSIEEQERIVRRTNSLMQFCGTLEEKLQSANKTAERLATAAISTLTGITTPTQEAPMKAPKTELKAPVRLGKTEPTVKDQAPLTNILTRHNSELSANDLWQRFGGEIDQFYAQLKTEVEQGWIIEPTGAEMLEKEAD